MITLSVEIPASRTLPAPLPLSLSTSHAHVAEVVDALGSVRDPSHLQHCLYLAQEFRLLPRRYWFASDGKAAGLPYSHVLDDHVRTLMASGIVQRDGSSLGIGIPLGDASDRDPSTPAVSPDRRLSALAQLGAEDTAALADAVFILNRRGRHPANRQFHADLRATLRLLLAERDEQPEVETRVDRIARICLFLREPASHGTAPAYAS